jgi:glycosyltransferase involved in cell wall biosynthesis
VSGTSKGESAPQSVSVVIPTYNRRERLPAVLEPLIQDPGASEIVVVVDGSTDGTTALLEGIGREEPRLRSVVIENRGPARARLAGAEAATGELVLALDDDVIAEPGLAAGHARRHAGRGRLVVLGYMPVAPRPRRPRAFARELYAREYERVVQGWENDPSSVLSSMWAGNFSIRRADYLALTGAIERIVTGYHEDLDFGLACLDAGLEGDFDRTLRAVHFYERDPSGFARDARSSGTNLPLVYARHADRLGELRPDFAFHDLPGPVRQLARAGTRLAPVRGLVQVGVATAGALRLFTLERLGAGLLWRMEQGAAAIRAGRAATTRPPRTGRAG